MKRRALLRAVGAAGVAGTTALAGCAAPGPTVEIVDVDEMPERNGVSIDVELLQSQFTTDHPARLRTIVTNHETPKPLSARGDAMCGLFNRQKAESDPSGLWLHPPRATEDISRKDGRWGRDRDAERGRAFLQYGCSLRQYAADEARGQVYEIWDDYRTSGYLSPGTYRWEIGVDVGDVNEESVEVETFDWGFSLELG